MFARIERGAAVGKTVIIGFGNLLMGDDGAGIHLIQKLANESLPAQVELVDGGVNSFAALAEVHSASQAILIDTMAGGGAPGSIYRLTAQQLDALPKKSALSVHEFSLSDALQLVGRIGELPPILIYGIEPESLELSLQLSRPVELAVEKVIRFIHEDIGSK